MSVTITNAGFDWGAAADVLGAISTVVLVFLTFVQVRASRRELHRRLNPLLIHVRTAGPPTPRVRIFNEGGGVARNIGVNLSLVPPGGSGPSVFFGSLSVLRPGQQQVLELQQMDGYDDSLLMRDHDEVLVLTYTDPDGVQHDDEGERHRVHVEPPFEP